MTEQIMQIGLKQIRPSEGNRRVGGFDKAKLEQLADSIRAAVVKSGSRRARRIVSRDESSNSISRSTRAPEGMMPEVGTP